MYLFSQGIFYFELHQMFQDARPTKSRPLKIKKVYRKGEPALRLSVGRSVNFIELPSDGPMQDKTVANVVNTLKGKFEHVQYQADE